MAIDYLTRMSTDPIGSMLHIGGGPRRNTSGPAPVKYVGGSGPDGRPGPHVGGETWEMNAIKDGQFFAGPSQWQAGFSGGGNSPNRIHGYDQSGIPTNQFQDAFGRAPTTNDYIHEMGGLSPKMPSLLDQYYSRLASSMSGGYFRPRPNVDPSSGGIQASKPTTGVDFDAGNLEPFPAKNMGIAMAADGGGVPAGQPTIVGERGPEMVVPQVPVEVIPNHALGMGDLHLMESQDLKDKHDAALQEMYWNRAVRRYGSPHNARVALREQEKQKELETGLNQNATYRTQAVDYDVPSLLNMYLQRAFQHV